MKSRQAYLKVLSYIVLAITISACVRGEPTIAATMYKDALPVPSTAVEISDGRSIGIPATSWGAVFTTDASMSEVVEWYEEELIRAGLEFVKSPEKPAAEGYTIFNIQEGKRRYMIVIVDEGSKSGAVIQLSERTKL